MRLLLGFALIFYIVASSLPIIAIPRQYPLKKRVMMGVGLLALCLHGVLLHHWIDVASGQNLNFFNMLSFSVWLIGVLVWIIVLLQPLDLLISFIFPLAALSMILVIVFPGAYIVNTANSPAMLFHILGSLFTFCVLALAGLLAVLLAVQERLLRYKKINGLAQKLPALETVERLLFQAVSLGFGLLTLVLVTSFYFYHNLLWQHLLLLQKASLVLLAWGVLLMLLIGRYLYGWRGWRAIYYTLTGVLLLLAAYFLGKFVLEMLIK